MIFQDTAPHPRRHNTLIILFLAAAAFLLYANTFNSPFTFDDRQNIEENLAIRLTQLTPTALYDAAFKSLLPHRPVANLSFALNYYFGRYNVAGYHAVNILIHALSAVFLYLFINATLALPSLAARYGPRRSIAFFTALIWLAHPVQTQSVTYIVQRMNSLAAMFYILSLFLYVRGRLATVGRRQWMWFTGAGLAGLLALGSKEIAATLPFFILLYEWYFLQDLDKTWLKRRLPYIIGALLVFGIIAFLFLGGNPIDRILSGYNHRDFTLPERLLTEFRVVIFYITLLLFPYPGRLNLDHDFPISHSLLDPMTTMPAIAAMAGLLVLACFTVKKHRLFSFCILWFLGNLVIESSVIGLEIVFEHRLYLPAMLAILPAVIFIYRYIKPQWLGIAVMCGIVAVFSVWTYQRNNVWADEITLWQDCVNKSPAKARPHYNLGNLLRRQGKFKEAIDHYYEALQTKSIYADDVYNGLGIILKAQGKTKEAINHYHEALRINPGLAEAHSNLGNALTSQGRIKEAIDHFYEALRIQPDFAEAHNSLGSALARQGKSKEAMRHYYEALRIKPNFVEAHNNLGNALASQGRIKEAIDHFYEALRIEPENADAHNNLGIALARQGRIKEAADHFYEALRIEPDFAGARENLEHALRIQ